MSDQNTASNEAQFNENPEIVETGTEETNIQEWLPEQETKTENKWQSKAIKLLAQRNEARNEAEELKARLEALENRFSTQDTAEIASIKNSFKASYWEDALNKAQEMQNQHSSLSLEQAYQLTGWTLQKNPTRFSTPWRTPSDLTKATTTQDLSMNDLEAAAEAELRAMIAW